MRVWISIATGAMQSSAIVINAEIMMDFQLAACAEMLWPQQPIAWRAARLKEMGFGVGLWNWVDHDVDALEKTGARFTIMNGYIEGRLGDDEGAEMLLASARETADIGERLGVERLNLHGTGLGDGGIPVWQHEHVSDQMWIKARDTLHRICDLARKICCLYTGKPEPARSSGMPALLQQLTCWHWFPAIDRPELRINLDLYHTQIGEGDIIRWIGKCLPWIGEIQVADNPGRASRVQAR